MLRSWTFTSDRYAARRAPGCTRAGYQIVIGIVPATIRSIAPTGCAPVGAGSRITGIIIALTTTPSDAVANVCPVFDIVRKVVAQEPSRNGRGRES